MIAVSAPSGSELSLQQNTHDSLVNGHVESYYSAEKAEWSEPTFVADPYLRVHGLSPALNYGQQAYEGLKGKTLLKRTSPQRQPFLNTRHSLSRTRRSDQYIPP